MPQVLIAGYYGQGNAGDEAILAVIQRDIGALVEDCRFVVAAGTGTAASAAVPLSDVPGLIDAVRASDLVVLGGGGLFQDYWPVATDRMLTGEQGGLPAYVSLPVIAHLAGRRSMLYAVGVGPLRTEEGREQTRAAFVLADAATVRDRESLDVVESLGVGAGGGPAVEVVADPAFRLPAAPPDQVSQAWQQLGIEDESRVIGVVLREWAFGPDQSVWEQQVADALARLLDEGSRALLLPFDTGPAGDLPVCDRVAALIARPDRTSVLRGGAAPQLLAGLVGRCSVVLTMRYHAAVFAASASVPVVSLTYDPKLHNHMSASGQGELSLAPAQWRTDVVANALVRARDTDVRAVARWSSGQADAAARSARTAAHLLAQDRPRQPAPLVGRLALDRVRSDALARAAAAEARRALEATDARLTVTATALADARQHSAAELGRLTAEQRRLTAEGDELREALRRERDTAQRELTALQDALTELRREADRLQDERNLAEARRASAEADLRLVTSSPAYRLARPVWRAGDAAMPLGSRRRKLYHRTRAALARPARGGDQPSTLATADGAVQEALLGLRRFLQSAAEGPAVLVLAGTQLVESEGQRPTQLSLELASRGCPVVFGYWRWDREQWLPQDRIEDGVYQVPLDVLVDHAGAVVAGLPDRPGVVLATFPYPGLFRLVSDLDSAGWVVLYDVMDDWEEFHRVGQADWFDAAFEAHLASRADVVTAINGPLARRVREIAGRAVDVVPNGLKPGVERLAGSAAGRRRGSVTVGYFGHLTPAWFDWPLLAAAAGRRPDWQWYVIGYGGDSPVPLPANVTLLGRQAQRDLASFAADWDVALVPFIESRLSECADPIKTYEYLAMGLPVVVTGVHPPPGMEQHVTRASGVEEFVHAIEGAARADGPADRQARRDLAFGATWGDRAHALLTLVQEPQTPEAVMKPFLLAGRP